MPWRATDLSTSPPSRQIAAGDREALAFNAETVIASATAILTRLDTYAAFPTGIETVVTATPLVTVTVSGLARGVDYELAVTFVTGAGRRWTRVVVLEVVA